MGVVCHVGLINELPLTVLKGNTVVEPTFSVKLQKDFFFFLPNTRDQLQLQKGNLELSSYQYQKVLYIYSFIKVHS